MIGVSLLNHKMPKKKIIHPPTEKFTSARVRVITIRGKRYVQVREKGVIREQQRYTPSKAKLSTLRSRYNRQGSIDVNKTRTRLTNFYEVDYYNKKKTPTRRYQYFFRATLSNGDTIWAASQSADSDYPVEQAKEEAEENLAYRLAGLEGNYQDVDLGMEAIDTRTVGRLRIVSIKEGIRQYES